MLGDDGNPSKLKGKGFLKTNLTPLAPSSSVSEHAFTSSRAITTWKDLNGFPVEITVNNLVQQHGRRMFCGGIRDFTERQQIQNRLDKETTS